MTEIRTSVPMSSFAAVAFHISSPYTNPSGAMAMQGSERTHSDTQVRPIGYGGFRWDVVRETARTRDQMAAQFTEGALNT